MCRSLRAARISSLTRCSFVNASEFCRNLISIRCAQPARSYRRISCFLRGALEGCNLRTSWFSCTACSTCRTLSPSAYSPSQRPGHSSARVLIPTCITTGCRHSGGGPPTCTSRALQRSRSATPAKLYLNFVRAAPRHRNGVVPRWKNSERESTTSFSSCSTTSASASTSASSAHSASRCSAALVFLS